MAIKKRKATAKKAGSSKGAATHGKQFTKSGAGASRTSAIGTAPTKKTGKSEPAVRTPSKAPVTRSGSGASLLPTRASSRIAAATSSIAPTSSAIATPSAVPKQQTTTPSKTGKALTARMSRENDVWPVRGIVAEEKVGARTRYQIDWYPQDKRTKKAQEYDYNWEWEDSVGKEAIDEWNRKTVAQKKKSATAAKAGNPKLKKK